ncbi:MAG: hypothetical protein J7621_06180 [Niastella sp.]|nr:hypothetical protein [Niastella sp.]
MATKKKAVPKKAGKKKAAKKKGAVKTKNVGKKNKLGVENSLVNNINARKEKGVSRSKSKKTISKESYKHMQNNWED